MEFLLPHTDGGVAVQLVVVVVVLIAAVVVSRKNPPVRLFVLGLGVLTLAFFALRTIH